jgi:catechol 2,3-dioxygenase-like lactoylglutathione lyase family enzyme
MPFAHLTLATRDVNRTRSFFEQTLGWARINRPANIDVPAAWLEIAPGQELHIIEIPDFAPSAHEREYGRHVAITYPHAEFERLQARLREHGAEVIPALRATPFARFFFRDPNGYIFEVIEDSYTPER